MNPGIRSNRAALHAAALVFTAALAALPGCFSMRSARTERTQPAQPAPADAWPARDRAVAERLRDQTPAAITWLQLPEGSTDPVPGPIEATVTESRLAPSGGLLRLYHEPDDEADDDELAARFASLLGDFEPSGTYVSSYLLQSGRFHDWLARERASRAAMKPLGGTVPEGTRRSTLSAEIALTEGVRFQLPDPAPPGGHTGGRGLILHFSALMSNEYEKKFLDQLRARGWTVIDFDTWSGLDAPRDPAALARLPELEQQRRRLEAEQKAFFESRDFKSPRYKASLKESGQLLSEIWRIQRGWFTACTPDDGQAAGRDIAAAVDSALAENAYAAEAVLDYAAERRPDLPAGPIVVIGFSAGAIAAPAVAARLGERVDALVLIGGGADIFQIARTTDLKGQRIHLRCNDQPADDATFAAAHDAYRRHTRLDPYALGPLLERTPVLMVHARQDQTVPAAAGELLYNRLGRPDRLDFSMDHYKLFYFIPDQAARVGDWLDRHAPRGR